MIRVLTLSGNAYQQGWQHGQQVRDLLPGLRAAMKVRRSAMPPTRNDLKPRLAEIDRVWRQFAPATLDMVHGIAAALGLEWDEYFTYTVGSYLIDHLKHSEAPEGCTTWAAAGSVTRDGAPLLAKNRDFRPVHQPLQCLVRVQPEHGHSYLYLTSAGSPGVYSSGINAAGLAVADTHVTCRGVGPGVARYTVMMDLLEGCATVEQAEAYVFSVPHFGDGTVTVADAHGGMAVFELAHTAQAVRRPSEDFVVSTNHFNAPETGNYCIDDSPPLLRGNSDARWGVVDAALRQARGQVDIPWTQALMARHGDNLSSICRHPKVKSRSVTISSVIFQPQQRSLYVCNGFPCQAQFERYSVET